MDAPRFIEDALTAGKHVLAEKPIAPSVEAAVALIKVYDTVRTERHPHVTLSIAENFRFLPTLRAALDEARTLGKLAGFRANAFFMVDTGRLALP
jgi:predicted dehydrogenase